MFKLVIVTLACIATTLAYPLELEDIFEDENGQQYFLEPIEQVEHHRVRRHHCETHPNCPTNTRTKYGVGSGGAYVSHTKTVVNNDRHKLDATFHGERQYSPKGPLTTGQKVDYSYKPSASTFSLGTQNTRGQGTDLSASGRYNFFQSQDGKAKVGAYAEYNRHFSGPQGTGHPDYEVGIRASADI